MLQVDDMREEKLKCFIADNFNNIDDLIKIKKADFRAFKDEDIPKDFLSRVISIKDKMLLDGTPINLRDLKVNGKDVEFFGVEKKDIGKTLEDLRYLCIDEPSLNNREKLLKILYKRVKA